MAHPTHGLADLFCFFLLLCRKNYPSLDPAYNSISFFFVSSPETQIYWILEISLCMLFLFRNWCCSNSGAHLSFSQLAGTPQRPPWNTSSYLCGLSLWKLNLPPISSQIGNQQIFQPPLYLVTSSAISQPRQTWFWPTLAPMAYQLEHVIIA